MAASIKISELNSLTDLTDVDLFLVSDMETGTSRKISYNNLKSNVITGTASALSSLEDLVAQNKTDAENLVETVRVALQASIDSNSSDSDIADNGLDARLDVLESDPVTKTYVDTKVSEVIGGAPEALDTLNELAQAMGDNPTLITDIGTRVTALEVDPVSKTEAETLIETAKVALQASIDSNASDSNIADNGLDVRLQVLESDPTTQADVDAVNQSLTISIGTLSGNVTQNATDISALQTTIGNLDIDIAPETLNSIDELAQALGDDPQIITNLQSQLTDYITHIEARNLEASLAEGYLYADTLFGG